MIIAFVTLLAIAVLVVTILDRTCDSNTDSPSAGQSDETNPVNTAPRSPAVAICETLLA